MKNVPKIDRRMVEKEISQYHEVWIDIPDKDLEIHFGYVWIRNGKSSSSKKSFMNYLTTTSQLVHFYQYFKNRIAAHAKYSDFPIIRL